ncbi:DUF4041 domain-containing protein [Aerococcus sp. 1KP-2016]|uniref:DUF4041 domain-containing protein n=1 Tax=Aerococcus sp. 1KP-2016 TaxID=1981982 RepID=UPI000B987223|nr:DUF4041 domain-containing protein [Aerococcus sp. 1KP-2016]OYQ64675.1 ATPase [Aerococcus sp. 1KP-2016]
MGFFDFLKKLPVDEVLTEKVRMLNHQISQKSEELKELKKQISDAKKDIEILDYGFYERKYKFSDSQKYKEKIAKIRDEEKKMVKDDRAGIIVNPMQLNGSASKGKTMQNQLIKAMIRGFNGEADALLVKITVSNVESKINALERTYTQLNTLYKRNEITIHPAYLKLKKEELYLAAEFEMQKEAEKQLLREQREKEKEDKKLQKEIATKRAQLNKDRTHYSNMIQKVKELLKVTAVEDHEDLLRQLAEYENKLTELDDIEENIDFREGHATAGYVYIISNIGSFGENVYKIGVTRRLEPLERIRELSSASVPFQFDVHALIFSENAFGLENEIHKKLTKYRVNQINERKEYFKVPFTIIQEILDNHSELAIEVTEDAEAFEYRQTQLLLKNRKNSMS